MKGLLLKDVYMINKYCRAYILVIVLFLAVSVFGNGNMFLTIYPYLITGMLLVTLITYDEREKWSEYAGTLPYTRAQIVSAKYILGLSIIMPVIIFTAIVRAVETITAKTFIFNEYCTLLMTLVSISLIVPAIILPFIFKFGAEKGRIIYYVFIGGTCAIGASLEKINGNPFTLLAEVSPVPAGFLIAILLYVLSWLLSIHFYKNREI